MCENDVRKVIIIGSGLVGSLCACFMARRGYNVTIYEKREDMRLVKDSKGRSINLSLSHRGRHALRAVGLEDEILKAAVPMKGRLLHLESGDLKSVLYDPTFKQCIYSVGRNFLNRKLLEAAETYTNVRIHFNHKLIRSNFNDGTVTLLNMKTNGEIRRKADLIIGADGAFSKLRLAMQQTAMFQFSQEYIEHGYLELSIPPKLSDRMIPNHLHIWPRGEFMMIALPNLDASWTVTLFMPFRKFDALDNVESVLMFFEHTFPDAVSLIGKNEIAKAFLTTKPSQLISVKCSPYHLGSNCLLLGDAAHAMGVHGRCGFQVFNDTWQGRAPRGEFMMIALPNLDASWTVTLFMPFRKFDALDNVESVLMFFEHTFPDAVSLIGKNEIAKAFLTTKPSQLISVKCSPYHLGSNCLLLGDAAHAMGVHGRCGFQVFNDTWQGRAPRGEFMMIALPNLDASWTVTLFMPFRKFDALDNVESVLMFFEHTFPDAVSLIGKNEIAKAFLTTKPSRLISVKCSPYHLGPNCLLLGDAAHAMVPFFGQGMNAGFQDCSILDDLLERNNDDIERSIREYSQVRVENGHAICDLAMYNYIEMRDLVSRTSYHLRKNVDNLMFRTFPTMWIPLYNSVSFTTMDYVQCKENRNWQDKVIHTILGAAGLLIFFVLFYCFFKLW